jgi:hypothetical protein
VVLNPGCGLVCEGGRALLASADWAGYNVLRCELH